MFANRKLSATTGGVVISSHKCIFSSTSSLVYHLLGAVSRETTLCWCLDVIESAAADCATNELDSQRVVVGPSEIRTCSFLS
mmetsp:Transcript_137/g.185  ORF Transcript_137/g.185 Transcript_137/m.185 type:complete len:82 (+) Transcript_137:357-602(+)